MVACWCNRLGTLPVIRRSQVPLQITAWLCSLHHCAPLSRSSRLRWYGHVLRKEDNDWVKKCMEYEVEGARPRGRPEKTWREIAEKRLRHVD